eukprot:GHVS01054472.1.p1 GENE.GHVS01054472.1~~GHVS01054472.1.p1  ORF type:complete len:154 (-),score=17.47 GHVS01054472.1:104-565(-)
MVYTARVDMGLKEEGDYFVHVPRRHTRHLLSVPKLSSSMPATAVGFLLVALLILVRRCVVVVTLFLIRELLSTMIFSAVGIHSVVVSVCAGSFFACPLVAKVAKAKIRKFFADAWYGGSVQHDHLEGRQLHALSPTICAAHRVYRYRVVAITV